MRGWLPRGRETEKRERWGSSPRPEPGGEGAHSILTAAWCSAQLPGPRGGREPTHPTGGMPA